MSDPSGAEDMIWKPSAFFTANATRPLGMTAGENAGSSSGVTARWFLPSESIAQIRKLPPSRFE